jgi:hypothetical protein
MTGSGTLSTGPSEVDTPEHRFGPFFACVMGLRGSSKYGIAVALRNPKSDRSTAVIKLNLRQPQNTTGAHARSCAIAMLVIQFRSYFEVLFLLKSCDPNELSKKIRQCTGTADIKPSTYIDSAEATNQYSG